MRALIFIVLLLSLPAQAQVYDIVRTIKHSDIFTEDTATTLNESFISTGTMEIAGNSIIRNFHTCEFGICKDFTMHDEILGLHPSNKSVSIFGDSGDLVSVEILSLQPTLILLFDDAKTQSYRIDEYKLRE